MTIVRLMSEGGNHVTPPSGALWVCNDSTGEVVRVDRNLGGLESLPREPTHHLIEVASLTILSSSRAGRRYAVVHLVTPDSSPCLKPPDPKWAHGCIRLILRLAPAYPNGYYRTNQIDIQVSSTGKDLYYDPFEMLKIAF